ncbi:mitogen-activated protein kinase kinase kinase [Salvia divinorum]|uniref:Mitogen-activated protein kinase kinase kinase n=1 Tax=Salvia divinorum TaxID=28513 RepID=A0ABD1FX44_SALDI
MSRFFLPIRFSISRRLRHREVPLSPASCPPVVAWRLSRCRGTRLLPEPLLHIKAESSSFPTRVAAKFKIGNSKELPEIPNHLSEEGRSFVKQCL